MKQTLSSESDGGVDIWLRKDGELSLVQCKHWKTRKVGVQVLREMYGVMIANQASRMIIVTTGDFTSEALNFAQGKRLWLINGSELVHMVKDGRYSFENPPAEAEVSEDIAPICPSCHSKLVIRVAKKGANIGTKFYGCSSFPKCRYTQSQK